MGGLYTLRIIRSAEGTVTTMPSTLRWAVVLVGAEAVGLGALLIFLLYEDATAKASSVSGAVVVTVYTALMAALLGLLAWGLSRRRAWARGPAVVLQILALPIGYSMATSGLGWLGVLLIVVGLSGAAALLARPTRAALSQR
jgi:hypothetical protein